MELYPIRDFQHIEIAFWLYLRDMPIIFSHIYFGRFHLVVPHDRYSHDTCLHMLDTISHFLCCAELHPIHDF